MIGHQPLELLVYWLPPPNEGLISRVSVSLIMCTGGAQRPFLHDRISVTPPVSVCPAYYAAYHPPPARVPSLCHALRSICAISQTALGSGLNLMHLRRDNRGAFRDRAKLGSCSEPDTRYCSVGSEHQHDAPRRRAARCPDGF